MMQSAGAEFYLGDGLSRRPEAIEVDFRRLVALDTLICDPPRSFTSDLRLLGWVDEKSRFLRRMLRNLA